MELSWRQTSAKTPPRPLTSHTEFFSKRAKASINERFPHISSQILNAMHPPLRAYNAQLIMGLAWSVFALQKAK
jgi:hypothetical protein